MLALRLGKQKKEKKVRKTKVKKNYKGTGFRIVDDEDPFSHGYNTNVAKDSDDEGVEESPQIASIIDERPVEVQALEEFQKGKWKHMESAAPQMSTSSFSRVGHDSEDDMSPQQLRRQRHDSDGDLDHSPPRGRQRHDSDGDLAHSPPRCRQRHDSDDNSPPGLRKRHDSGDLSPPRRSKRQNSGDMSPPRARQRHDSGDLSPPRQRSRHDSNGYDSPPRRRKRRDSGGSDLSTPRGPTNSRHSSKSKRDRDSSPPRRPNNQPQESRRSIVNPEVVETTKGELLKRTLEGKKAGLQRAADLRNEMVDYRRKENEMFENLDDEISGRTAKTKLRDRNTGKERDLVAELAKKEEEDRIAAEKKKQYDKWGKGLKQVEEQSARVNEALHEISKPMARYANDQDLDAYLKVQDRDGDPMLKYLKKKGNSGKPLYNGPPPPPNRFAILPGYRWDGVDRSNGYEREWFSHINAKKALQEEAYKWSVEDL